jgi:hypothetical protein
VVLWNDRPFPLGPPRADLDQHMPFAVAPPRGRGRLAAYPGGRGMTDTATITLVRHSAHVSRLRAYRIFVDDREVARAKNGASVTLEVSSGTHRVFVKRDWVRSHPLEVALGAGEHIEVDCVTSPDPIQLLHAGFGRPSGHISLHRRDEAGRPSAHVAALTRVDKSAPKKAALWFAGCVAVGFAASILIGWLVKPDAVGDRLSLLVGEVSGFVGVVGAGWILIRRSSKA